MLKKLDASVESVNVNSDTDMRQDVDELRETAQMYDRQRKRDQREVDRISQKYMEAESEITEKLNELAEMEDKYADLKSELETAWEENRRMVSENDDLRRDREQRQGNEIEAMERIDEQFEEIEMLRSKVGEERARSQYESGTIHQFKEQAIEQKDRATELQRTVDKLQEEVTELTKQGADNAEVALEHLELMDAVRSLQSGHQQDYTALTDIVAAFKHCVTPAFIIDTRRQVIKHVHQLSSRLNSAELKLNNLSKLLNKRLAPLSATANESEAEADAVLHIELKQLAREVVDGVQISDFFLTQLLTNAEKKTLDLSPKYQVEDCFFTRERQRYIEKGILDKNSYGRVAEKRPVKRSTTPTRTRAPQ
eukprot:gene25031-1639_t